MAGTEMTVVGATHWVPVAPGPGHPRPIAACGLDMDKISGSWSTSRTPWGRTPTCPTCRDRAILRLTATPEPPPNP
jgi:hypothetical protein